MSMTTREFNRRITMMDKVNQIKKDLKILLPEIEQDKYIQMLAHLYRYHRNKREYYARNGRTGNSKVKPLTKAEIVLLDYLLKNNINSKTIYKWFLVSRLPDDIKDKLRKGEIPVNIARKIATNRLRQKQSNTGLLMMEEIKNIVGSL